jgi:hypothetical protein
MINKIQLWSAIWGLLKARSHVNMSISVMEWEEHVTAHSTVEEFAEALAQIYNYNILKEWSDQTSSQTKQ